MLLLQTHGWDSAKVQDNSKIVPLSPASVTKLQMLKGPPEKSVKSIATQCGFSYRTILGELIYAYVICRMDIGYAVCFLARFSDAPHKAHFDALKHVCKYLRATKSWSLMFRRPEPSR